ncbi:MAG TPA: hypothetical protein PKV91_01315 [Bacillota bacterium]|jgi:hypothetical protein|nr:hypothetical protein [Bacillota bacterium]HOA35006.1 hypothetical protein [Bacillota bacterium]HOJ83764.1 hypothetical protein [Bacillota bacterium]HOL15004.1 hypothetical protein [Bacillota bacterium]HPZ10975.1 hypothetical protein [Bacillota bacterium]
MKKIAFLVMAVFTFLIIHEGAHMVVAHAYGELEAFRLHFYGAEVIFKTPVEERSGIQWGFISGSANALTLALGYLLLAIRKSLAALRNSFWRNYFYYLALLFLLIDAFNLSIGPFFYGGDIGGITVGFGLNRYLIQGIFLLVLLLNRELIVRKLFPVFGVKTSHPLFQPLFKR